MDTTQVRPTDSASVRANPEVWLFTGVLVTPLEKIAIILILILRCLHNYMFFPSA